jgi:hypothetical protein
MTLKIVLQEKEKKEGEKKTKTLNAHLQKYS